ncbi:pantothenate transporter liz1 [Dothidotthia symphoricarpi CBS 119687]|uniref:Pantothenate transporter liz1 n=1 Tax=Dothidotthia symphoricarpi CBS 119687 TaxID=1392245 RepID=A0A6A5ZZM2_9PLEO|nr:pantothenate transporter liz1 [Dothidotthia symphoricarpi CBS 119687]KAF2124736.1 pantothenate transporter liz1 [Dothidotthia symphoricarpi CBS 119687]
MATTIDFDQKGTTDRLSNDVGSRATDTGHAPSSSKLTPPPLVAAMSHEQRQQAEARMRKKIDTRLLPMIILMYIMNYLDRNNIAAVRLAGLQDELNLSSVQYQTIVSILFVGYVLFQVPSNLFLNKTGKPAIYLPSCMIVWGIISGATGACQNFGGLLACRFFLGFVEAAYFPGCLFYLSAWYTRKELGFRTAILYSGSLISGAFGGLITAGITSNMDGLHGLRAWRYVFLIEGAITIGIAFAAFFILPNFPRTTSWLTEEERQLAVYRLQEDIGEDDWTSAESQTFFHGLKLALVDIKTWVFTVLLLSIVSSASVTNFFPTVVKTLGYDNIHTLLLTAPPYVLAVITTYINAWHADRTGERFFHIVLPLCVGVASFIIAAATTSIGPRYFAMMLMIPGVYTGYVVVLAWVSNSMPRPPAKRAAALAFINAISNTSSIYASYMYPQTKGNKQPNLVLPLSVDCGTAALAIIMTVVMRIILGRLNKKLDKGEHVEGAINAVPGAGQDRAFRFLV